MSAEKKPKKEKHLLYSIFNPAGSGKGLSKEEAKKPRNLKNFFPFVGRNFNLLFGLNIFMFVGNFPIFFGLLALTGIFNINTTSAASPLFPVLYGAKQLGAGSPAFAALYGVHGVQSAISLPTTVTKTFFWLTLLIVFTFGIVNLSVTYVMRNIVKGDPVSPVSDIVYSIKRNWKQGILLGVIDLLILFVIGYDILVFYLSSSISTLYSVLFGGMIVIALAYMMMRYYMYIMLVTFDLSIFKIIKNSFIFAVVGMKRNIVATLGIAAIVVLDFFFFLTIMPVGIILPLLILVALIHFIGVYAAYPRIKEIMIDPYYVSDDVGAMTHEEAAAAEPVEEEEPIFTDRG